MTDTTTTTTTTTEAQLRTAAGVKFRRLLNERLTTFLDRGAGYQYLETPAGWEFRWTLTRDDAGLFHAEVRKPSGKGAQTGRATTLTVARTASRKTRHAARAQACRWYVKRLETEAELQSPWAKARGIPKAARDKLVRWQNTREEIV